MNKAFNADDFLNMQTVLTVGFGNAVASAAKRCGISLCDAEILLLFYNNPVYIEDYRKTVYCGLSEDYTLSSLKSLTEQGYVETDSDFANIKITGKGGIIAKSLSNAQNRFFESATACISEEESRILKELCEKISHSALQI